MHFERLQFRYLPRKKLRLHFLRNRQFALQPLFFFLFQNQLFDGFRHRVERQRKLRQLVRGFHRNAMAEVTAIDIFRSVIELGHGACHRPGHTRADDQRHQLNYREEDQDRQEDVFHALGDISQGCKQVRIEHRRPGSHLYKSAGPRQIASFPVHNGKRRSEGDLTIHHVRRVGERSHGERWMENLTSRSGTSFPFPNSAAVLGLLPFVEKTGFKTMLIRRVWVPVIWVRLVEHDACAIDGNFAQISGDVRDQILIQRLAGDYCEFFRSDIKYGSHAQIQLIMVANNFLEGLAFANHFRVRALIFVEEVRKIHRRRIRAPAADQQNPRPVPGTDSPSAPSAIAFS